MTMPVNATETSNDQTPSWKVVKMNEFVVKYEFSGGPWGHKESYMTEQQIMRSDPHNSSYPTSNFVSLCSATGLQL